MKTTRTLLLSGAALLLLSLSPACSDAPADDAADADVGEGDGRVLIPEKDGIQQDVADARSPQDAVEDALEPEPDVSGFQYPCDPMTVESCVTACVSAGTRKCLKDWGPCIPPAEWCGNCQDDDCDGLVNEECPENPACTPVEPECPVAIITVAEEAQVSVGTLLHLSAKESHSSAGAIVQWQWDVQAPAGSTAWFVPDETVENPTFDAALAGQYLFSLSVWDDKGTQSCSPAQVVVNVAPFPPVNPEVGCADGEREGFLSLDQYPQVAACSGAWDQPGITPDTVKQTCGGKGGDDSPNATGKGCSSADLCAAGWHLCDGWKELAEKSPTGCAGATPPDAKPKSLFFALKQPSKNGSVCGQPGAGFNDVFGCGNLGAGLGPDKSCGPLDRVLASTQPNSCGFNEAEPPLGPWQCNGPQDSHLNEGALVTKKECGSGTCSYDGYAVAAYDKGGVLCCHD
jgi:hypothetical protein